MSRDEFDASLRSLVPPVAALRASIHTFEAQAAAELSAVDAARAASARNLVHYLALRRQDLRELQDALAAVGLSSLGRAEPCVSATLDGVLQLLARATGGAAPQPDDHAVTLAEGRRLLAHNTVRLLGHGRGTRRARILVTLPSEAADDAALVRELVRRGMDGARINCAHDGPEAWAKMIAHVRQAAAERAVACPVLMDLAGPKLRTGALEPGPPVVKLRPRRDSCGRVLAPAHAWLVAREQARAAPLDATALPLDGAWLRQLAAGDDLTLDDARGAHRRLRVTSVSADGARVETTRSTYILDGTTLHHRQGETAVGPLPATEAWLRLRPGDHLMLTRDPAPGHDGEPPQIPCTLPQVFADVRPGERIWFDDGAIGGRITAVDADRLSVEITTARPDGAKLRADRGINLPDTHLRLPALDPRDEPDLAFVAAHADVVGYSFVRRPSDVIELHERLVRLGRRDLGVILKIETREAFENLPELLLAALRRPAVGVMIARGDLAVECGWERLAELQEEILWICEAAHVPVVWATQVLEHLAKEGQPSRAEITDAAMAERAECVMLNKGPHLPEALHVLDDILRRMEGHQSKKRSMLRPLALAERFAERSMR